MLSFTDAATLLGAKSPTVVKLDRALGGAILAAGGLHLATGVTVLKGAKFVVEHGQSLVGQLNERIGRTRRHERYEVLVAAHTVVAVTAFFEAADAPWLSEKFELVREEQLALATPAPEPTPADRDLIDSLLHLEVPVPSPEQSLAETEAVLFAVYHRMSKGLQRFLAGLAPWDALPWSTRSEYTSRLESEVPHRALELYRRELRQLASSRPEFMVWTTLNELHAASSKQKSIGRALDRLEQLLLEMTASGDGIGQASAALARAHDDLLQSPMLPVDASQLPEGLNAPLLCDGYVDPAFRVAVIGAGSQPADDRWWDRSGELRQDLAGFLAGYLLTPRAAATPLVVLGHPGAGKSLLTKVFAARVHGPALLTVRIELRSVNADDLIREQIEDAIYLTTGRRYSWAQLAEEASSTDTVPVVLFDGFDEMLQATGKSQSDFLKRIQEFQYQEGVQGRPVVAVVTSRTVVASQATFPSGCVAIRLETFDEPRVRAWVDRWNQTNTDYFTRRNIAELNPASLIPHMSLAEQPLLLSMLALYDCTAERGAGLDGYGTRLSAARLYEELLQRFVARDVGKGADARRIDSSTFEKRAEEDLDRLAVIAFGTLNRNMKSVTHRQLDADIRALTTGRRGGEDPLDQTTGQLAVGRFFFVHESLTRLNPDDGALHSYEFVHATFAEYLIARKAFRMLTRMAKLRQMTDELGGKPVDTSDDEALLFVLLSFAPLSDIPQILLFIQQLAVEQARPMRDQLTAVAHGLFRNAYNAKNLGRYGDYQPIRRNIVARHVVYSLNALLLELAVRPQDDALLTELFHTEEIPETLAEWSASARMWRAQLVPGSWDTLMETLAVSVSTAVPMGGPLIPQSTAQPSVWLRSRRLISADTSEQPSAPVLKPEVEGTRGDRLRVALASADFLMDRDMHALADVARALDGSVAGFDQDVRFRTKPPRDSDGSRRPQSLAVTLARLRIGAYADLGMLTLDIRTLLAALARDGGEPDKLISVLLNAVRNHRFVLPRDLVDDVIACVQNDLKRRYSKGEEWTTDDAVAIAEIWLAGLNSSWLGEPSSALSDVAALISSRRSSDEKLRLLIAVLDAGALGEPLLDYASVLLRQVNPAVLARTDPPLLVGAFRLAAALHRRDWLTTTGLECLRQLSFVDLLRVPSEIVSIACVRRAGDNSEGRQVEERVRGYFRAAEGRGYKMRRSVSPNG